MRTRTLTILGVVLIALGVAFALMSKEWIEETFGFEPDGGNGTLELLFALVPIVAGAALLVYVVVQHGDASRARPGTAAGREEVER